MTKNTAGYPLPPGDAFEEDLACMLVFYPDRDEYRQAFFSSLHGLGNWLAWERDPSKKGKDAAQSWKLANELTRECLEMNTCETIVNLLTEIRDNSALNCCDVVDISDGDQYTDEIEDGVGDVPQNVIDAGYATGVSDWEGFAEYKCMVSHVMVDNMTAQLEQILSYMLPAGSVLGGIPTLAAVASVIFIDALSVLVYAIALGASVSVRLAAGVAFLGKPGLEDLIDDMATNHEALACAIYNADGVDDAIVQLRLVVSELFSVGASEVLNNLNLDPQLKALYSGRYDEQDIAEMLVAKGYDTGDFDCECDEPLTAPSGWEWVVVPEPSFYYTWNVTRITDNFDAPTSTITMSCTLDSGKSRWEKNISFPNIGSDVCFYYGIAMRLKALDSPTDEGETFGHKPAIYISAGRLDLWQMGVNTDQLTGSQWDDMIAEHADFDVSWADNFHTQMRTDEKPDSSGDDNESYTWSIEVYSLRPI